MVLAMKTHSGKLTTKDCFACTNFVPTEELCIKGHKPRFYMPKHPLDFNFGFKRKCLDFVNRGEYVGTGDAV